MRIMVSGSREYTDEDTIRYALEDAAGVARKVTVIHGSARGADRLAGITAEEWGFAVEEYPADWSAGSKIGPIRNSEMLASGVDQALFFFCSTAANVGTRDAAKKARSLDIPSRYFVDDREVDYAELRRIIRPF